MNTQTVIKVRHPFSLWTLARAGWLALAALILVALVRAAPVYLAEQMQICSASASQCAQQVLLTTERLRQFEAVGISLSTWAAYTLVSRLILNLVWSSVALIIFLRKPAERMPLFVAFFLLTFSTNNGVINALGRSNPAWWLPVQILTAAAWTSFLLFFTVFPSGHFAPRWMRWVAASFVAILLPGIFFPGTALDLGETLPWFPSIYFPGLFLLMLWSQIYRYRRVSTAVQRQQTKWVVYGITLMFLLVIGFILPTIFRPVYTQSNFYFVLSGGLANDILLLLPLSIAIAMLRSRLWDIDRLINRTLVYGALTFCIGAVYVLLVGLLTNLFQVQNTVWLSLLVTVAIAILFQPLRERLQRGVNRWLYGQRDEPYAVLSRLGSRLEASLAPDTLLPVIVETTARALKLPYAAILLGSGDRQTLGAEYPPLSGKWNQEDDLKQMRLHLPLMYQGEPFGELVIEPRAPDEPLADADHRLLVDLVRQASMAIHAARLTLDLQQAREQLVIALEEERRRLRRDLHDGLGPQLANFAMLAETARDLYARDPNRAEALLDKAVGQAQAAIEDIRRLVDNLRPPALDEMGLVAALREQLAGYAHTTIRFQFTAPESLPALPAAVEVAVYRITQEAVSNVVQHARASQCSISLALGETVELGIWDNGAGIPTVYAAGVGLHSMRERAAELGGACFIESNDQGTSIQVQLPIPKDG